MRRNGRRILAGLAATALLTVLQPGVRGQGTDAGGGSAGGGGLVIESSVGQPFSSVSTSGGGVEIRSGLLEASLVPASPRTADFDRDGKVAFSDFLLFAAGFGRTSGDPAFDARLDLDGDGTIGFGDFLRFAALFQT